MIIKKLKSKIHRARLTKVDIDYEGSITIDKDLIAAAHLEPFESVHVWNVSTGARLETYVMEAPAGSGEIGLNGAAARGAVVGDIVIIASWCWPEAGEKTESAVILVDEQNRVKVGKA
jgi:aspartate 1-decarboxylase